MGRLLITGAAGFLGRAVVRLAAHRSDRSRLLTTSRADTPVVADIEHVAADLRTPEGWRRLSDDVEQVLHLAAVVPAPSRTGDSVDNVTMALGLVKRSREWARLERIVFASTILVYGPRSDVLTEEVTPAPAHPYAKAKLACEEAILAAPVRTIVLRFSSIYGEGQAPHTVLPTFLRRAMAGQDLELSGDGSRTQDFVFVDDAAEATLLAARVDARGVFNIGSGRALSMRELAQAVVTVCAVPRVRISTDPARVETAASVRLPIERARRILGYAPQTTLHEGLRSVARSCRP